MNRSRIADSMVGCIVNATILSLTVIPAIFLLWQRHRLANKPDKHLNRNIYSDPFFIVCYHSQLQPTMFGPDADRNEHSIGNLPEQVMKDFSYLQHSHMRQVKF
jgi:hypothetical protein